MSELFLDVKKNASIAFVVLARLVVEGIVGPQNLSQLCNSCDEEDCQSTLMLSLYRVFSC